MTKPLLAGCADINAPPQRRVDLDQLRIAACLLLFPFHTGQVFDQHQAYHIKSQTQLVGLEIVDRSINAFHMTLFFVLAGMSAMLALRGAPSAWAFIGDRLRRLMPPLVLGLLTIAPAIKYFERLGGRDMTYEGVELSPGWVPPPILDFYTTFLTDFDSFTWSHLWFLAYLIVLSALMTPLLLALRRTSHTCPYDARWLIWAPLPVFLVIELILRPLCGDLHNFMTDWANISLYVTALAMGAALIHWPELEVQVGRQFPAFATLALVGFTVMAVSWQGPAYVAGRACANWGMIGTLIGACRWISWPHGRMDSYLAKAQLPIYVLHHLPLVMIAYVLRDVPWPLPLRYGAILAGSVIVTFAVYHVAIRPFQGRRPQPQVVAEPIAAG